MATSVGRTPATVKANDNYFVSMFNKFLDADKSWSETKFYDDAMIGVGSGTGGPRYVMSIDNADQSEAHRCLHFVRHNQQGANSADFISAVPVLYVPNDNILISTPGIGIPAMPLFEVISPTITNVGGKSFQLTWWTNVDDVSKCSGGMGYDPTIIKKFSSNDIENFEDSQGAARLLCTAPIVWENLSTVAPPAQGAETTGVVKYLPTPVIYNVGVVHLVTGEGYIVDFSTGGGAGGMRVHSHTSMEDGGFAVSVYAPSAMIRPANWF